MYAGQVVEQASTHDLLIDPRHEYTRGLLGSVLSIEAGAERLHQVPGTVPSPRDFARGDRFAPRSVDPAADPTARPRLVRLDGSDHRVATTGADRKSTRLNSSHVAISYAVFCLKKKKREQDKIETSQTDCRY